VRKRELV